MILSLTLHTREWHDDGKRKWLCCVSQHCSIWNLGDLVEKLLNMKFMGFSRNLWDLVEQLAGEERHFKLWQAYR